MSNETNKVPAVPAGLRTKITMLHVYAKAIAEDLERMTDMYRDLYEEYVAWLDTFGALATREAEDTLLAEADRASGFAALGEELGRVQRLGGAIFDMPGEAAR